MTHQKVNNTPILTSTSGFCNIPQGQNSMSNQFNNVKENN